MFTGEPITDCSYFISTMQSAIQADSVFMTDDQMMKVTKGLSVWVHQDNLSIVCEGLVQGEWGCEDNSHMIQTNSSMSTAAHEMLHVFSDNLGISKADNINHANWNTKGAPEGSKSYSEMNNFSGQPIEDGSWWDIVTRWMWDQLSSFEDRFCPDSHTC